MIFNETEIKESLSTVKELDNNVYECLLSKIEFNKLQRLKKVTRQMIRRYLARGIREYNERINIKDIISRINQPSPKRKILYISPIPTFNLLRQSIYLKNSGEFETIILMESPWLGSFVEKYFDTVYVYDSIYALVNILKKVNPYIIHVLGCSYYSEYFSILAKLLSKCKVVFEFFDIPSLSIPKEDLIEMHGKANAELIYFSEKFACEKSDGLIIGYSSEAHEILKNRYHIKAPMLEFHPYVCEEFISDSNGKYSDLDGKTHLVYGGNVAPSHSWERLLGDVMFHSLVEKVTKQGIYFDIYCTPHSSSIKFKREFWDYILMAKKSELFKFEKGVPLNEATKKFAKYDFGAMIYLYDRGTFLKEHNSTRLPGKFFTYIESGLPIIISEEVGYGAKIVKEYEIGIVISQKDLDNLPQIIGRYDRNKLKANVKRAQKELSMERHIGQLVSFYEEVHQIALSN